MNGERGDEFPFMLTGHGVFVVESDKGIFFSVQDINRDFAVRSGITPHGNWAKPRKFI